MASEGHLEDRKKSFYSSPLRDVWVSGILVVNMLKYKNSDIEFWIRYIIDISYTNLE